MSLDLSFAVPFSSQDLVLCGMKISLHRNLKGYLFPQKISSNDKTKLAQFILQGLKSYKGDLAIVDAPIPLTIKETFLDVANDISHFLIDTQNDITYAVNDNDHLVVTWHTHANDFKTLYDGIKKLEDALSPLFDFSHDKARGFLTSYPEISGLGCSIQAYLFCPHTETFPKINERFALEPFAQESSMYVLKTKQTHSLDLSALLKAYLDTVNLVIKSENDATLVEMNKNKDTLLDQVSKSLALLKGSFQLNFSDTLQHLLNLKLGFHLGFLEGLEKDICLKLLNLASKSHLSESLKQKDSKDDWLHERAGWIQKELAVVKIKI